MRLIDADTLLEKVERIQPWDAYLGKYAQGIRHCMELVSLLIQDAPTIEPERKTGEWIEVQYRVLGGHKFIKSQRCPKCGKIKDKYVTWNFCPNCGVDMRKRINNVCK